jgi:hypothetical protein
MFDNYPDKRFGSISVDEFENAIPARGYERSGVESYSPNVDLNNNVTGIKPPGRDWHGFTYDITDNLAGYQPPTLAGISNPNTGYAFDSNSNRLSKATPSGTISGTYDAQDRMETYGGCAYQYTANGEMTNKTCGASLTQFDIDVIGQSAQRHLAEQHADSLFDRR